MSSRVAAPPWPWSLVLLLLGAILAGASPARGQEEEAEDDVDPEARYIMPESAFDSWAFHHGQTEHSVRAQLEAQLELAIDEVDRASKLTEAQRGKLQLAGQGDIARYFEEVEVVRRRFLLLRADVRQGRDRLNNIWKELEPIRQKLAAGLFRDDSIFRKAVRRVVSPEHAARLAEVARERRANGYRSRIEWVVAMLDNAMPLREEQRQPLVRFLLAETRPPKRSGEYDHYVILWQMSLLPEDKLRPLFNEAQWKVLDHQFGEMKGVREYLEKNGWLALEGDPEPAATTAPAPKAEEK